VTGFQRVDLFDVAAMQGFYARAEDNFVTFQGHTSAAAQDQHNDFRGFCMPLNLRFFFSVYLSHGTDFSCAVIPA
jgi:hypothetical protein